MSFLPPVLLCEQLPSPSTIEDLGEATADLGEATADALLLAASKDYDIYIYTYICIYIDVHIHYP